VLAARGLSVPGDVKVIGFDDVYLATSSMPPLSTIRQDIPAGAAHLVSILMKRVAGERTGSVILNPELIVRGTT